MYTLPIKQMLVIRPTLAGMMSPILYNYPKRIKSRIGIFFHSQLHRAPAVVGLFDQQPKQGPSAVKKMKIFPPQLNVGHKTNIGGT